jgi:hypothetical protein
MANGVEVRVPYLSRGVATSAGTTPINGTFGSDKLLLRKAAATMMPADLQELCLGREKQSAPSNARVVADAVELFAQDVLSSEYVDGHPGLKFKTALAGRASWILGCDLLAAGIVLYNGTPPVEFTARSLYRMISRDVLRDAVDQVWRAET